MIWIIIIASMAASFYVQHMLKKRFTEYSQTPIAMTGKEVAEKMLHDNGIIDVKVISVPGQLTDHYNPMEKTVNLSEAVYHQQNIAAAAVAAHECGHAVQHATSYSWLTMRSTLVPVVSLTSNMLTWVLLAGIGLMMFTGNIYILSLGVFMFALVTLFSFITLPVEFDASKRALVWLDNAHITSTTQHTQAKSALWWAAMTYVVAAIASLANLLYYASFLTGGD